MTQNLYEPSFLLERAVKCGDWMVCNQIKDRMDANKGRGIRSYDANTKEKVLTGNWMTGTMAMSLSALWKRTGDEKYREAAILAARYIMSLQVMDREDYFFGAIREITPQSMEFAPRDATTGAWGLAWVYDATGDAKYLDRAVLFADWLIEKGMYRGWPMYAMYMEPHLEHFYSRGSFQSGAGLFFHDMFRFTGDQKYIERGLLPISTIYRDDFIQEDGSLVLERDPFTGAVSERAEPNSEGIMPMHVFNDDFGAAAMLAAGRLFNDSSYMEKTSLYLHWLASLQEEDGGYQGDRAPSGVPVSQMHFRDYGEILGDKELLAHADLALKKMISMQFLETGDPCVDGAFRGMYEGKEPNKWDRTCVNMRATSYALMALLKAESDLADIWLGIHNKPFKDHRWVGLHNLIW